MRRKRGDTPPEPMDADARRRFSSALAIVGLSNLQRAAARLCARYGVRRRRRRTICPSHALEPDELLDEAIARVLAGRRAWRDDVPMAAYMQIVMKNILFATMRRAHVSTHVTTERPDVMVALAGTDEAEQRATAFSRDLFEDVRGLFRGDDDACAYVTCFWFEADERSEIGRKLQWPVRKVDFVRARVLAVLRRADFNHLLEN